MRGLHRGFCRLGGFGAQASGVWCRWVEVSWQGPASKGGLGTPQGGMGRAQPGRFQVACAPVGLSGVVWDVLYATGFRLQHGSLVSLWFLQMLSRDPLVHANSLPRLNGRLGSRCAPTLTMFGGPSTAGASDNSRLHKVTAVKIDFVPQSMGGSWRWNPGCLSRSTSWPNDQGHRHQKVALKAG